MKEGDQSLHLVSMAAPAPPPIGANINQSVNYHKKLGAKNPNEDSKVLWVINEHFN